MVLFYLIAKFFKVLKFCFQNMGERRRRARCREEKKKKRQRYILIVSILAFLFIGLLVALPRVLLFVPTE